MSFAELPYCSSSSAKRLAPGLAGVDDLSTASVYQYKKKKKNEHIHTLDRKWRENVRLCMNEYVSECIEMWD